MAEQTAIGLFYTSGAAHDVANRLKYQGVAAADIAIRQMHETAPVPPAAAAEARGYAADPFWGSLILKKFGDRIGDGETAVCVRARDDDAVRMAVGTMRQYTPVGIELVAPDEVGAFRAAEQAKPAP